MNEDETPSAATEIQALAEEARTEAAEAEALAAAARARARLIQLRREAELVEAQQQEATDEPESSEDKAGGNTVGVLLLLAFAAFIITDAISGQRAAGIAFWIVALGLPALYVFVSALGTAWRGNRNDELLKVAVLAVELAQHSGSADTFTADDLPQIRGHGELRGEVRARDE